MRFLQKHGGPCAMHSTVYPPFTQGLGPPSKYSVHIIKPSIPDHLHQNSPVAIPRAFQQTLETLEIFRSLRSLKTLKTLENLGKPCYPSDPSFRQLEANNINMSGDAINTSSNPSNPPVPQAHSVQQTIHQVPCRSPEPQFEMEMAGWVTNECLSRRTLAI